MIKKDTFNNDVIEVLDFAMEKHFLFGTESPESLNIRTITEIPENFPDAGPDGKKYVDLLPGEDNYMGIRSEAMVELYGRMGSDKKINKLCENIDIFFERAKYYEDVYAIYPQEDGMLADFIREDMITCAYHRAIFGKRPGFWETIFQIYKSGGMPVGWSGKYPEGRFMAIYPGLECK